MLLAFGFAFGAVSMIFGFVLLAAEDVTAFLRLVVAACEVAGRAGGEGVGFCRTLLPVRFTDDLADGVGLGGGRGVSDCLM